MGLALHLLSPVALSSVFNYGLLFCHSPYFLYFYFLFLQKKISLHLAVFKTMLTTAQWESYLRTYGNLLTGVICQKQSKSARRLPGVTRKY